MTHEHDPNASKCSCGCHEHHNTTYVYIPFDTGSRGSGSVSGLGSGLLWFIGIFAGIAVVVDIGIEDLIGGLCILFVVLVTVVTILIWMTSLIKKLLRRSPKGIKQDEIGQDCLYQGKKQKKQDKVE